jgi:hypothetical protein
VDADETDEEPLGGLSLAIVLDEPDAAGAESVSASS